MNQSTSTGTSPCCSTPQHLYSRMSWGLLFVFLLTAAAFAGSARAAGNEECLAKAWKGTIGGVPVMMEFNFDGEDAALVGRYYYRTSLVDLLLMKDGAKPGRWKELDPKGKVSGYLTLECMDNSLTGTWSSPDGSKMLPLSAEARQETEYTKNRRDAFKPTVTKSDTIGEHKFELFIAKGFDSVVGLRLIGDGKALADINGTLTNRFADQLQEATDCMAYGRWRRGEDHGYEYQTEMNMIAWNKSFVVVGESNSQYCGGAHPIVGSGATTYSLQTGREEDVSQWLIDRYRKEIPKDSPLGKLILKNYSTGDDSENDCEEYIELSGESAWPTANGMVFQPSAAHVHTGCIEEITVSYKDLAPYLSPSGKTNIQAFQGR